MIQKGMLTLLFAVLPAMAGPVVTGLTNYASGDTTTLIVAGAKYSVWGTGLSGAKVAVSNIAMYILATTSTRVDFVTPEYLGQSGQVTIRATVNGWVSNAIYATQAPADPAYYVCSPGNPIIKQNGIVVGGCAEDTIINPGLGRNLTITANALVNPRQTCVLSVTVAGIPATGVSCSQNTLSTVWSIAFTVPLSVSWSTQVVTVIANGVPLPNFFIHWGSAVQFWPTPPIFPAPMPPPSGGDL